MFARPGSTALRRALMVAHWTGLALLIALLVAGVTPFTKVAFLVAVALWAAVLARQGLRARPGPVLTGPLRTAFRPAHWSLLILLAVNAGLVAVAPPGELAGAVRTVTLLSIGAGLLHGVFHMWRHTALGDGALRTMTPRAMHFIL